METLDNAEEVAKDSKLPVLEAYDALRVLYGDILRGYSFHKPETIYIKHFDDLDNIQIECSFLGSVAISCGSCGQTGNIESTCVGCHKPSLYCDICLMPVLGLASSCPNCNHGGHSYHMSEWFEKRLKCDQIAFKIRTLVKC